MPTQVFSGVDALGNTLTIDTATDLVDCFVNGVKTILDADYSVTSNQVELVNGAVTDPTTIEIIVLAEQRPLLPLTTIKVNVAEWSIDGTNNQFPLLDYSNNDISVVSATDCRVSVDGIIQEPLVDYTLLNNSTQGTTVIIFSTPPQPDQTIWMVAGTPGGAGGGGEVFFGPSPPFNPTNGVLWWTASGTLYGFDGALGVWVQLAGATA